MSRENPEVSRLVEWFSQNTKTFVVDTAIEAKDRYNMAERTRLTDRAAFLLAKQIISLNMVSRTVIRTAKGDMLRLQVQAVDPIVWSPTNGKTYDADSCPDEPSEHDPK
jgi:hypothetical protein